MTYILLALASALCLGVYEVARKQAVTQSAPLPILCVASAGALVSLGLAILACRLFDPGGAWGIVLVPLSLGHHGLILIKSAIVSASWICAYVAVQRLPISVAAPLRAMSPALTLVLAVLIFGEMPKIVSWLGMLTIFCGYFWFSVLGRHEGIVWRTNRAVGILILGTLIGATSGLYDKHLLQHVKLPPTTLQFWFTSYGLLLQSLTAYFLWWKRQERAKFTWTWAAPLVGVLLSLADQFYFRSLRQTDALVSVVSLVRRSSVIVSFTLGGWWFREQLLRSKAKALVLVVVGLGILVLAK